MHAFFITVINVDKTFQLIDIDKNSIATQYVRKMDNFRNGGNGAITIIRLGNHIQRVRLFVERNHNRIIQVIVKMFITETFTSSTTVSPQFFERFFVVFIIELVDVNITG